MIQEYEIVGGHTMSHQVAADHIWFMVVTNSFKFVYELFHQLGTEIVTQDSLRMLFDIGFHLNTVE
jgi:translation initiation factor 2B subunit (eIF-2B alpha/beta/delta family)